MLTGLTKVATGLRNAASMAIDPATGDLLYADNGIDGTDGGNEAYSTDTLHRIAAARHRQDRARLTASLTATR